MSPTDAAPVPLPSGHENRLLSEGLIELALVAPYSADARGRKPHLATLRRWAKNGCRGHKLETTFLGNRLMTTRQAVARFLAAINGGPPAPSGLAPATDSGAAKAGEQLAAAGV